MSYVLEVNGQQLKDVSEIKLVKQEQTSDYLFEKNKLYAYLGADLVKLFKKYELFVAGGTIASLFTNKEINDIDIYARSEEAAISFLEDIWSVHVVSNTNKAIQFSYQEKLLQLIHFSYFEKAEDIFETFDYTACMGAFDFKTEEFVLHNEFLKHNSQRILKFNSNTAFPIVSLLRVQKYEGKGYTISKPEFIRVILTCMNLDINTYEELKEQLGGMYGQAYEKLFEDVKDEEFNLQEAIDKIANLALSEDYFKEPISNDFNDLDDLIDGIAKLPFKFVEMGNGIYRIGYKGTLKEYDNDLPDGAIEVSADEFLKDLKIYKFVKKNNDTYSSYYKESFKYKVGQEIVADGEASNWSDAGKLYFNLKDSIEDSTYYSKNDKALIEAMIKKDDIVHFGDSVVKVKKANITREVLESEWKAWIGEEVSEGYEEEESELPFFD